MYFNLFPKKPEVDLGDLNVILAHIRDVYERPTVANTGD